MANKNFKENIDISERYSRKLISGKVSATTGVRNPHNLAMVYGEPANRIEVLRKLEKQNRFRWIWYSIFLALGVVCLILEPKSWFQCLDLAVVMVNIDLVSQGKISGLYIGVIECFMYAYICFATGLYGEVIKMFAVNIPLNIFSLVSWTKNLKKQKTVSYKEQEEKAVVVRKLKVKNYWWILLLVGVVYGLCCLGLKFLSTSALYFSAGVLALTIFSKILSGLCYKENWWFSIASHIISCAMWIEVIITSSAGGIDLVELPQLVAVVAGLVNAFYGYQIWKSMYRKVAVNGGEVLAKRKVKINKIIKLRKQYQKLIWNSEIDISRNS